MSSKELEAGTAAIRVETHDADPKEAALRSEAIDEQTARYTTGPPIEIDAATNKRLFWKLNCRILIIQLATYFCQSLDKGTLNFASINGNQDGRETCWATGKCSSTRQSSIAQY